MHKIPTLFRRDPDDRKRVLPEAHPACQWVLDGEGRPTRKYDGTCVMLDEDGTWWARREVRPGRTRPPGYQPVMTDDVTGKTVGWEPIEQSPYARYHAEALADSPERHRPGTYELIGPKINGNPEGVRGHELVRHGDAEKLDVPRDLDGLRDWLLAHPRYEGIVWHHPDGRRAKLKHRDFA
ncbi:DUF5565 family protein [Micromonospora soli]|uniref:RNA ligase 1 family protein n=1 Tax=Micromonospora sp. NBRC 110009 TaxID=3061627 RepID=UPI002673BD26|nr:DUF5565 family protein [Micromonospora sp. NBRC 110009]WKT97679.1 DUF5565 family protein [Micromonospora sp. NBRC 110009]